MKDFSTPVYEDWGSHDIMYTRGGAMTEWKNCVTRREIMYTLHRILLWS